MEQSRRVSHADPMDCSPHPVSTTGDLPFGGYASNPRPERHRSIRSGAVKDAGCEWIATQQCVAGERINHSDPESCRPAEGSQTMVQCTKSHPTGRLLWDPHHGYTKPAGWKNMHADLRHHTANGKICLPPMGCSDQFGIHPIDLSRESYHSDQCPCDPHRDHLPLTINGRFFRLKTGRFRTAPSIREPRRSFSFSGRRMFCSPLRNDGQSSHSTKARRFVM